jgi:hypothetical protein
MDLCPELNSFWKLTGMSDSVKVQRQDEFQQVLPFGKPHDPVLSDVHKWKRAHVET